MQVERSKKGLKSPLERIRSVRKKTREGISRRIHNTVYAVKHPQDTLNNFMEFGVSNYKELRQGMTPFEEKAFGLGLGIAAIALMGLAGIGWVENLSDKVIVPLAASTPLFPILTTTVAIIKEKLAKVPTSFALLAEKDRKERVIEDKDRMVPKDFHYGPEQEKADVLAALDQKYRGYKGKKKLKLSANEFEVEKANGTLFETLVGAPGDRPEWFLDSEHRYVESSDGTLVAKEGTRDIRNLTADDFSHLRLHDYAKEMLEKGAYTGLGFYYRPEDNLTADSVILRQHKGKLQILLIERSDGLGAAVPGGMIDPDELKTLTPQTALKVALKVAKRETGEEANLNLDAVTSVPLLHNVVVGDPRATVQAFPRSTVFLFMPDAATAAAMTPKHGDDASGAKWRWLNVNRRMMPSHRSFVYVGIQEWQKRTGLVVDRRGRIGKAA